MARTALRNVWFVKTKAFKGARRLCKTKMFISGVDPKPKAMKAMKAMKATKPKAIKPMKATKPKAIKPMKAMKAMKRASTPHLRGSRVGKVDVSGKRWGGQFSAGVKPCDGAAFECIQRGRVLVAVRRMR